MSSHALVRMLGHARYEAYRQAACGDEALATGLYAWSTEVSGAWHTHLNYVEVAMRNAIDRELSAWNATQLGPDGTRLLTGWTEPEAAADPIYEILRGTLKRSREHAKREAQRRPPSHPRFGLPPTHDDGVAQLTFGDWTRLIAPANAAEPQLHQQILWKSCLHRAFPGVRSDDSGRLLVGKGANALRHLRNRVAHHDNLLTVNINGRLNESLSLLAKIDPEFPALAMARSRLRRLAREDPRLNE